MLTQQELDYGVTEDDLEFGMETFEEQMLVLSLYQEFKEIVTNQVSWTKWHIMERKNVTYGVAEKILLTAVEDGLVKPEDYHGRFVVIK